MVPTNKNQQGAPRIIKDFVRRGENVARNDEEVRRQNLLRLIETDDRFGTARALADALGYNESRISHLKTGHRRIKPAVARGMEEKLGLQPGYFDIDHNATGGPRVDRNAAAQRYIAREATARQLAQEYSVPETTIYRWVADYRQAEDSGTMSRPVIQPRQANGGSDDLREENRMLRQMLDILLKKERT